MKGMCVVGALAAVTLTAGCENRPTVAGPSPVLAPGALQSPTVGLEARTVPFSGRFEGRSSLTPLEPPLARVLVEGSGTASHLGRFNITMPHVVSFATGEGTGTFTLTAANGDELSGTFTGHEEEGPQFSFLEQLIVTGGTGRFTGATGSFTLHRVLDPVTEHTSGTFEGVISPPGASHR